MPRGPRAPKLDLKNVEYKCARVDTRERESERDSVVLFRVISEEEATRKSSFWSHLNRKVDCSIVSSG